MTMGLSLCNNATKISELAQVFVICPTAKMIAGTIADNHSWTLAGKTVTLNRILSITDKITEFRS